MNCSNNDYSNRTSIKQPPNATVKFSKSMEKAYVNKKSKQQDGNPNIKNLKSILKS